MGKISEVIYQSLSDLDEDELNDYYFYTNLIGVNEQTNQMYEEYEMKQKKLRDQIVGDFMRKEKWKLKLSSVIFGVSPCTHKPILIVETE